MKKKKNTTTIDLRDKDLKKKDHQEKRDRSSIGIEMILPLTLNLPRSLKNYFRNQTLKSIKKVSKNLKQKDKF